MSLVEEMAGAQTSALSASKHVCAHTQTHVHTHNHTSSTKHSSTYDRDAICIPYISMLTSHDKQKQIKCKSIATTRCKHRHVIGETRQTCKEQTTTSRLTTGIKPHAQTRTRKMTTQTIQIHCCNRSQIGTVLVESTPTHDEPQTKPQKS